LNVKAAPEAEDQDEIAALPVSRKVSERDAETLFHIVTSVLADGADRGAGLRNIR
jgi:hypothetical protein